jgi:uncharacterized protein (DUF4415 family)
MGNGLCPWLGIQLRVLLVCHCYRADRIVRIISRSSGSLQNDATTPRTYAKRYDFQRKPNPYLAKRKRQITIRLDESTIEYWGLAEGTGIPYQNLINLYLRECSREEASEAGLGGLTRNNACTAGGQQPRRRVVIISGLSKVRAVVGRWGRR